MADKPSLLLHQQSQADEPVLKETKIEDTSSYSKERNGGCPNKHRDLSLMALICFFPCGIIAMHASSQVERLYSMGRLEEAASLSDRAEVYSARAISCMTAFLLCTLLVLLSGILILCFLAIDCDKTTCDW